MSSNAEMSFLDHLEELRWHIIRSVAAVIVFTTVAFLSKTFVFQVLILGPSKTSFLTYQLLCDLGTAISLPGLCIDSIPFKLQSRIMTGQFTMHLLASVVLGFVCAFPYAFWEVWRFVKPGLHETEKQVSRWATFTVSVLFMMGVCFGYFVVSPLAINFLANYQLDASISNEFDITSYVQTLAMIVMACGLMFQLPVVVYFLSKIGLLTPAIMKEYRRHSFVVILIIGAIITPPDPFTQLLVSGPVYMLYELSIFVSARVEKHARKMEALAAKGLA